MKSGGIRGKAAISAAKLASKVLRLTGRSATALPGQIAESIDPSALADVLSPLSKVIIVVGTNGKTTTTAYLVQMLRAAGHEVVTNSAGSNFTRGIISEMIMTKVSPSSIGVFELDEAHSRHFIDKYPPDHTLVLNLMRDQLDRYGEIDTTRTLLARAAGKAKVSAVVNSNNEALAQACSSAQENIIYFGASADTAGQLSHHDNPDPTEGKGALLTGFNPDKSSLSLTINGQDYAVESKISGLHNAMNFLAAITAALEVDAEGLDQFLKVAAKPPTIFGRGESITYKGAQFILHLVKNPEGFKRSLQAASANNSSAFAFVINDDYADGRDPSWLWDVDVYSTYAQGRKLVCSGSRAYDMRLCLMYQDENFDPEVIKDTSRMIECFQPDKIEKIDVFCTYTAMLQLRRQLQGKSTGKGLRL